MLEHTHRADPGTSISLPPAKRTRKSNKMAVAWSGFDCLSSLFARAHLACHPCIRVGRVLYRQPFCGADDADVFGSYHCLSDGLSRVEKQWGQAEWCVRMVHNHGSLSHGENCGAFLFAGSHPSTTTTGGVWPLGLPGT